MKETQLKKILARAREYEPTPGDEDADLVVRVIPMLITEIRRLNRIVDAK